MRCNSPSKQHKLNRLCSNSGTKRDTSSDTRVVFDSCQQHEQYKEVLACFSNMQNSILNITQHEQGTNSVEALAFYGAIVSHLNPPGSEKFPCGDSKDLKVSTRSKWASGASVGNAVYKDCECGRNLHGQHILHILGPLPGSTLLQARYPGFAGPVWKKHFCGELFWGAFDGKDLVEILRLSFIRKGKEPSKGLKEPFTQWSSNRAQFHRRGQIAIFNTALCPTGRWPWTIQIWTCVRGMTCTFQKK